MFQLAVQGFIIVELVRGIELERILISTNLLPVIREKFSSFRITGTDGCNIEQRM